MQQNFNSSKNGAVLEPRTGQISRTCGFEAKAKDLRLRGQGLQNVSSRPRTSSKTPPLFPMLASLTTWPQQHMCIHDDKKLLKSCIKLRYRFWCVCHKPRDVATPKMQLHNFMYRLVISPNVKFLALVVSTFLLNLAFKK